MNSRYIDIDFHIYHKNVYFFVENILWNETTK